MTPKLTRTLTIPATRVEAFAGVAFAATGGSVTLLDLLTGGTIQNLDLGPNAITDIALEGSFLYPMDTSRTLRAIEFLDLQMIPQGSLQLAEGGGQLFVGDRIAYVVASSKERGGFSTVNVADPDNLALISGSDADVPFFRSGKAIVATGSGWGILIGSPLGTDMLNVMDLHNLANTDVPVATIRLGARPSSVALASGIAFLANGGAGLRVVNYLPFDNKGLLPKVSLSASFSLNPPQAEEGKLVRLTAAVSDDVQVRDVEFYVDGARVATDSNFPFEHRFVTPTLTPAKTSFTIRAKATDTGGNFTWSDEISVMLIHDITPPHVRRVLPSAKSVAAPLTDKVLVYFSEPMKVSTLNGESFRLFAPGPDKRLGTADDVMVTDGVISYLDSLNVGVLTFPSALPVGIYQIVISPTITDLAGFPLGQELSATFGVLSGGGDGDDDDDGASNLQEIRRGTDPLNPDTDGDGWPDGVEIDDGKDPLDPNSRPSGGFVARPAVAVDLPFPETFGNQGTGVFVAAPPLSIDLPLPETFGSVGVGVVVARLPVAVELPLPEAFGTTGISVFLAQPPVSVKTEKP